MEIWKPFPPITLELPRIGGHLWLLRRGQLKLQWADVVDV